LEAGTRPLAVVLTLNVVVDLERGLKREVGISPKPVTGFWIGFA
jgi:hypothetical protein